MKDEMEFETYQGVVVPESALLKVERKNRYGSVPGLEDEELAEPDELERQVIRAEWGPILQLPVEGRKEAFRPDVDEDGYIVGAFGNADFERLKPAFDKSRYLADKLREERKHVVILFGIVNERVPGKQKYQVLKALQAGVIGLEQVSGDDVQQLGRLYLRVVRLNERIAGLVKASWRKSQERYQKWLDSLG